MKTEVTIEIHETDGEESPTANFPTMKFKSHWNRHESMVVICLEDKEITVLKKELIKAIENVTNQS